MSSLPDIECACATVRRAARIVTQLYSEELGPHVEPAQFSLLTMLQTHPGCNQATIGKALALDKTTLSRNLKFLRGKGWIEDVRAEDRRERGFQLTPAGRQVLKAAKPGWARAQRRLRSAMGDEDWAAMWAALSALTSATGRA